MLKSILMFIKSHTVSIIITAVVVTMGITSVLVIPQVVETYKLNQSVEKNLNKLVSSDFKSTKQVPNETTDDAPKNITTVSKVNTNKPLTFTIERVEKNYENGNKAVEFVIVPSYDKDFSKWSKEEKEAYDKVIKESAKMTLEEGKKMEQEENQRLDNAELEIQKIIDSWSKDYICGVGTVKYNSYTKKYSGSYNTITITSNNDSSGGISSESHYLTNDFKVDMSDIKNINDFGESGIDLNYLIK